MDARVIKTKKAIRDSFFDLLNEKEMSAITLTELAHRAKVNRQTIYNYYSGIHEILDDLITSLLEYYKKIIYQSDVIVSFDSPMVIFSKINFIIKNDEAFYKKFFTMKYNIVLKQYMSFALCDIIKDVFRKYKIFDNDKVDIIATYFVHGLIGCYQYYFDHDKLDLDDYSRYVCELVFNGLRKQIVINK